MKKKINRNQSESSISECKLLKRIPFHLNIVRLYDTFSTPTKDFYCVMEYMNGGNLYQLIQERRESNKSINLTETKSIMYQIFKALSHIHQHGIFHRDMKPENLLINDEGTGNIIIKLGDFGLAREFKSRLPYTDYVSTRWYRAPEVLLKATTYTSAIDLWAVGTIFAEIITLRPIFPGQSELDQLFRICQVLGSPGLMIQKRKSKSDRLNAGFMSSKTISTEYVGIGGPWKEGLKLAQKHGFQFPEVISYRSLNELVRKCIDTNLSRLSILHPLSKH
ncbi:kinase-like domain-containing protein [Pilobolus umbonatus]|nr:kinase-like domain-containing protein [Pilobolus umbonatus]